MRILALTDWVELFSERISSMTPVVDQEEREVEERTRRVISVADLERVNERVR